MDDYVYFIYVTENLVNGKLYIGQHRCKYEEQFTDGYLGSGHAFTNALKKYGKDNFERIIIEYANSPEELNALEAKYVDEEVMNNPMFYNLKTGGNQNSVLSAEVRKKLSNALKGNKNPKGKIVSEETRKKLSERFKGRKISEETRLKISKTRKGTPAWNKGKTGIYSEETRKKISEANKRRIISEETRRKISKISKGRKVSEETRKKLSDSLTGRTFSEETLKKMSESRKGRKVWNKGKTGIYSEETLKKIRQSKIGKKASEETRRKMSESQKRRQQRIRKAVDDSVNIEIKCSPNGQLYLF